MNSILLNESEFKEKLVQIYQEEKFKNLEEKWEKLNKHQKTFILEFLKNSDSKIIKEAQWWNTIGDIVGIFDPTGIVDLVNGLDYYRQGDYLFAVLSMISAVPYFGDLVGKPVMAMVKLGGVAADTLRVAFASKNASKLAQAATDLGGPTARLVESAPKWGPDLMKRLRAAAKKVPLLGSGVGLIDEWVDLFKAASGEMKAGSSTLKGLASAEKTTLKNTFNGFRTYQGGNKYLKYIAKKDVPLWNKFVGGAPRLFGNAATRSLMRRTKWYLGWLEYLGIVDTKTTPDELIEKYGTNLQQKINQYNQTPEAQKNWSEDFGSGGELYKADMAGEAPSDSTGISKTGGDIKSDPIDKLLDAIFS